MQPTGIVRKLDPIGRITLPAELRESHELPNGTELEILTDKDAIILRKQSPACTFCNSTEGLTDYQNKKICEKCILNIIRLRLSK